MGNKILDFKDLLKRFLAAIVEICLKKKKKKKKGVKHTITMTVTNTHFTYLFWLFRKYKSFLYFHF